MYHATQPDSRVSVLACHEKIGPGLKAVLRCAIIGPGREKGVRPAPAQ